MKHLALLAAVVLGLATLGTLAPTRAAHAVTCAEGVYRAGCAGPNGAAVVRKPPATVYHPHTVTCANGVYRAGCVGPNGEAVVRK